jgi:hypothetical protein
VGKALTALERAVKTIHIPHLPYVRPLRSWMAALTRSTKVLAEAAVITRTVSFAAVGGSWCGIKRKKDAMGGGTGVSARSDTQHYYTGHGSVTAP